MAEVEDKRKAGDLRNHQKSHLEKLMANPDKPVNIPEKPDDWKPREPPEFVRFYMGSSAGAGSEVFHVYRHLRRRENIRQQHIQENSEKDDLDEEFQERLAKNKMADDKRTSKKRAKRLKRKQNWKLAKGGQECQGESDEGNKTHVAADIKQEVKEEEEKEEEEEDESHFVIGGR